MSPRPCEHLLIQVLSPDYFLFLQLLLFSGIIAWLSCLAFYVHIASSSQTLQTATSTTSHIIVHTAKCVRTLVPPQSPLAALRCTASRRLTSPGRTPCLQDPTSPLLLLYSLRLVGLLLQELFEKWCTDNTFICSSGTSENIFILHSPLITSLAGIEFYFENCFHSEFLRLLLHSCLSASVALRNLTAF